jgi:hypothetical protein
MAITVTGKILDIQTKQPIINATVEQFNKPENAQSVSSDGSYTITIDDAETPISVEADGYGQTVGNPAMFTGNVYLYKIDASVTDKAAAISKNHVKMLPGTLITAVIIILLLKLLKAV